MKVLIGDKIELRGSIRVFYSYSHKDERFKTVLEDHLSILKRTHIIDEWNDRKISPGENWRIEIDLRLQNADIVLLLVSSNFLASDYCYETETIFALEQHEKGNCVVIPIIIKPCLWMKSEFKKLQPLPKNGKPVTKWQNRDEAWLDVTKGILEVAENIRQTKKLKEVVVSSPFIKVDEREMAPENNEALERILIRFLYRYSDYYFSPLRIQMWGSKQFEFKKLADFTVPEIKKELKRLLELKVLKMTISKKGNPIYKLGVNI